MFPAMSPIGLVVVCPCVDFLRPGILTSMSASSISLRVVCYKLEHVVVAAVFIKSMQATDASLCLVQDPQANVLVLDHFPRVPMAAQQHQPSMPQLEQAAQPQHPSIVPVQFRRPAVSAGQSTGVVDNSAGRHSAVVDKNFKQQTVVPATQIPAVMDPCLDQHAGGALLPAVSCGQSTGVVDSNAEQHRSAQLAVHQPPGYFLQCCH